MTRLGSAREISGAVTGASGTAASGQPEAGGSEEFLWAEHRPSSPWLFLSFMLACEVAGHAPSVPQPGPRWLIFNYSS